MSLKRAQDRAMSWSEDGDRVAVIKTAKGEIHLGYYWEYMNSAIPPDEIVEIYENGKRVI